VMRVTTIIETEIRRKGREWLAIYTFLLQMDDVSSRRYVVANTVT
jgi:hypothetical protein